MNRVNGYIILDDFLDEEEVATEEFQSSSKSVKEGNLRFWLELDNKQRVFFKLCGGNELNELIVEEILKELGIPCAHYDLAMFNGIKGVISYDYKKDGIKYIKGYDILKEYYDYLEVNNKFKDLLPDEKISFETDEPLLQTSYGMFGTIKEDLEEYFKVSSAEDIAGFIKLYEKIDGVLLGRCINKAISRTSHKPTEEKNKSIFNIFNENRKVIGEVITKYQENMKIGDKNGY